MQKLAVIGLGYVGLPLAKLAHERGFNVVGLDIDEAKLGSEYDFKVTSDFARLATADIVVVCVPTPVHANHRPNFEPLEAACKSLAAHLRAGQLVILESTVNPGVSEALVIPLLEQGSGLVCGQDFYVAHCPERINPGDEKWNLSNINRVVGGFCATSLERALAFYRTLITAEVKPMGSLKEAEAVKIVENAFRDINIAFVNELAMSFSKLGLDVVNVIEGASTKPFAFMSHQPGCGVGGHCIPVDPYYLIDYAKTNGFEHAFLSLARGINNQMPAFTVDQVKSLLQADGLALVGTRVAVLGLAYKPEIEDYRESPALDIVRLLGQAGAEVITYDPFVPHHSTAANLDAALEGAQVVVIATAHKVFKNLTPELLARRGITRLVDGRNCLPKAAMVKAGISYRGIGR